MSNISRIVYILVGVIIFIGCGWLTLALVQNAGQNTNIVFFGMPISVWIGIASSIAASGLFYSVSETLRWSFDREISTNYRRLHFFENHVGIKEFFSQKGEDIANSDYGKAIASARYRVWAFGISNGEFLEEHLENLISRKQVIPNLDVCICFIDPETKITVKDNSMGTTTFSQVQFFDVMRDDRLNGDQSNRVREGISRAQKRIRNSRTDIKIVLVSPAGYFSAMVVDDLIYFFPLTAVARDNTRTPYLKVGASSQMGRPLLGFLEHVKSHPRLSRATQ